MNEEIKFQFEEIESVCEDGIFDSEYVYDIEIDSHDNSCRTFIGNDILIHNSCYVTFQNVLDSCNYQDTKYKDDEVSFILDMYKFRLKDYLNNAFTKFAENRNTPNYQVFEMENVSKSLILNSKKKYTKNVLWEDSGIRYKSLSNIQNKGIEIIQSSTPALIRAELKNMLIYFHAGNVTTKEVVEKLKVLKEKMINEKNIDKVCKNLKVNDYEKYCVDDKNEIKVGLKCPLHVKSSVVYNWKLNNSEFKDKYENIQSGMKVKMYYTKGEYEAFAYVAGSFPVEFAPKIDYDVLFFKTVVEPINSFLEAMHLSIIDINLEFRKPIF